METITSQGAPIPRRRTSAPVARAVASRSSDCDSLDIRACQSVSIESFVRIWPRHHISIPPVHT